MQKKEPELSDTSLRVLMAQQMAQQKALRERLIRRHARENLYEKRRAKYAKQSGTGARECARRVRNA